MKCVNCEFYSVLIIQVSDCQNCITFSVSLLLGCGEGWKCDASAFYSLPQKTGRFWEQRFSSGLTKVSWGIFHISLEF